VLASVLIKKLPSRPMASNAEFEPFWWYEEMATAVSGRSKRASPLQVSSSRHTEGVVGQSPTKDNLDTPIRRQRRLAPLLRLWEFDAIAKNVRVGYVFFFDDRDEYLEGDRLVGQPDLRDSISAAMDRLGACRKKHHPDWILGVQPFWKPLGVELFHFLSA
jgi:hypothetical protein